MKRIYHRFQRIFFYYTQFFTRRIIYINNSFSKQLALTFDDGPDPVLTRQILVILNQYKIRATFFLLGTAIEKSPEIVKEIFNEGHCLGNHGYEHVSIENLTPGEAIECFEKTDTLIKKLTCKTDVNFYRPPYGIAPESYQIWIKKKGKYSVNWSLDSYDYRNEFDVIQIAEMILRDIQNGNIILFHDTRPSTAEVLKKVIPELLKRNYSFLTLDENI